MILKMELLFNLLNNETGLKCTAPLVLMQALLPVA
jgi:hypothetical protein